MTIMVDFNRIRNKKTNVDDLAKKAEEMKGGFKKDSRIWKPKRDSDGNFEGVIRFLDLSPEDLEIYDNICEQEGESVANSKVMPWVLIYGHSFKGPGGWYIENSRTTLSGDEPDPLSELNRAEWDDNDEAAKKRVSSRSRRKQYFSNVLIIKDPNNPELEGEVMIFQYGQKIFDKINGVLKPKFDSDPKFDPFNFYEGANFILKVYTETKGKSKFPNYDKSEFSVQTPLFNGDDDKIEALWKKTHSLQDLVSPDKFKSYDALKKRLDMVMKTGGASGVSTYNNNLVTDAEDDRPVSSPASHESSDAPDPAPSYSQTDIEDEDMDYFNNL